jgi:muramoyltetrapeptide carboxypeptidase
MTGAILVPSIVRATEGAINVPSSALPVMASRKLPTGIRQGATVGIVAPASGVHPKDIQDFVSLCESWGVKTKTGPNIGKRAGYLSASDKDRAAEFMRFVEDPTIDAIVCGRGGYGVMRILPMLDYGAIRDAGKIIMGFSDITALLIAVNQLSGLVTYHGPVASSTFDAFTTAAVTEVVAGLGDQEERALPTYTDPRVTVLRPGTAIGRLTGGNLAMIVSTLGTPYEIDTRGTILFLEEINEEPYRIDRMLTQLRLAGKLQECAGIAIGNFRDCEAKGTSVSEPSFTLMQVLEERIGDLGVPAVYGLPFGHVKSKLTLPLGIHAELNAGARSLRLLEPAVV